jgi:nucleoside-diphosphate-sugar epimerase
MHIVVFGANGPTGRLLIRQALDAGDEVTAVTRHPATFPFRDAALHVLHGDALDAASVQDAVAGKDAVLSTLGTPYSRKPVTLYSQGTANIVAAMQRTGVRRLVCVSSSATYPVPNPENGFVFERVLQPFFIGVVGKTLYDDLRRMEMLVRESDVDWVILRPSGLFDTPTVTSYQVAEGHLDTRFTSRADLADCMLRQASDDRSLRTALAVATVDAKPSMLKLLWREGISKSLHRARRGSESPATSAPVGAG